MLVFWLMWISLVLGGLAGVCRFRRALGERLQLARVPGLVPVPVRQRVYSGPEAGPALKELPVSSYRASGLWSPNTGPPAGTRLDGTSG